MSTTTEERKRGSILPYVLGGGVLAYVGYAYLKKSQEPTTLPPIIIPQPPASTTTPPPTGPYVFSNMTDNGRTVRTDSIGASPTFTMKNNGVVRSVKVRCSLILNQSSTAVLATLQKNGTSMGSVWVTEETSNDTAMRDRTIVFSNVDVKAGDTLNVVIGTLGAGRLWEFQVDANNAMFTTITVQ